MKTKSKIVLSIVLGGIMLSAGGAAYAGTSYQGFNETTPSLQQPRTFGNQTKAGSGVAGGIIVDSVGSNYTVNAKLRTGNTFGTEVKGLGDSSSASLPNSIGAGSTTQMTLTNNTWTTVTVQIVGSWRSN